MDVEGYDFIEAYSYRMSPRDKRDIRKILFAHFDLIVEAGRTFRRNAMAKVHEVESIRFNGGVMTIQVDGRELVVDLADCSPTLLRASEPQRNDYVVSPSGYGIHWRELDEDLSIDGLLGIKHAPPVMLKVAV